MPIGLVAGLRREPAEMKRLHRCCTASNGRLPLVLRQPSFDRPQLRRSQRLLPLAALVHTALAGCDCTDGRVVRRGKVAAAGDSDLASIECFFGCRIIADPVAIPMALPVLAVFGLAERLKRELDSRGAAWRARNPAAMERLSG